MLGEELAVAHMDTTMFFEDCAYLPEWPGVPFGDEEGEIISKTLGQKHAIQSVQSSRSAPGSHGRRGSTG
jgi:L-fuculose-phosphate aldolase